MSTAYDFHTLSPLDFETLVHDCLEAAWDMRLEAFGPGRDQGIDLRFLNGPHKVIVQAKHMVGSGYRALLRGVQAERDKALKLAPTRYLLATSVSLSPARKDEMIAALPGVPLVAGDILGQDELNAILRQHPELERRHFKLWLSSTAVLERILNSGVYNRTAAEMDIIKSMVPRFVQNQSVDEALRKLSETGALIVAGPPGVGKTTLARILLWLHAERDWHVYVVDTLEEAFKVAETTEKRLILLDDFLGQVRLSADHVRGIDARLPPLIARVAAHDNLRFVLTTRDYILAQARGLSARLSPGQLNAREYVLNVGRYTRAVKAQILYNHIYFSALAREQRDQLLADDFYLKIIDHQNFNPRIIEEVTAPDYLALTGRPIRQTVEAVLANPELLWERPYRQHITAEGRMLMIALSLNGRFAGVGALKSSFMRVARALGQEIHPADLESSFRATFKSLDGSALGLLGDLVTFANPGLRDFLQSVILSDRLVPLLLLQIETRAELSELFTVFSGAKPSDEEKTRLAPEWTAALDRMNEGGFCNRYDYLELAVDFASDLDHAPVLLRVEEGIAAIEEDPIDPDEVSQICSLLEKSVFCILPSEIEERFRSVVTGAAATLLIDHADVLSFEDIQSLDESLHEYGADKQLATTASRGAMERIVQSIDSEVRDIETVEDLDEFEDNILAFMKKRAFATSSLSRAIERQRERLYEDGRVQRRDSFGSGGSSRPDAGATDQEIRSMFRGLGSG